MSTRGIGLRHSTHSRFLVRRGNFLNILKVKVTNFIVARELMAEWQYYGYNQVLITQQPEPPTMVVVSTSTPTQQPFNANYDGSVNPNFSPNFCALE